MNLHAPAWDLSEIYRGLDDPKIQKDLAYVKKTSAAFEKKHRGKVAKYNLQQVLKMFAESEKTFRTTFLLTVYPDFCFTANTSDPKAASLMQKVELQLTEAANHFIFLDLELSKNPKLKSFAASDGPYKFMFQRIYQNSKHNLSQEQEVVANLKNISARSGWDKLFQQTEAQLKLDIDGKAYSIEQAMQMLHSPSRELRKKASIALNDALKKNNQLFSHIFNMLLVNKMQEDKLRKYASPEESRHISNGVSQKAVDALIDAILSKNDLVPRYYKIKKKLLGLKTLHEYDRYAPVSKKEDKLFSFPEASAMVKQAYQRFDPQFAKFFQDFVQQKHVDAEIRDGKRGGGYCSMMPKPISPYIFVNYQGKVSDIMTLAHEAGHGIHDMLFADEPFSVAHPSLTMCETASTFGERIMFDYLLQNTKTKQEKISLLCNYLEEVIGAIYRQAYYYVFEREMHASIQKEGEVSADKINAVWHKFQKQLYGNAIEFSDDYRHSWSYISHFYLYPFYVYAYALGNLLVFSLYDKYQKGEPDFVNKYKMMLALGGTRSTMDSVKIFGFDLEDPKFWQSGLGTIEALIDQLAALC